jgi:uracil-DNA glycosylase
MQAGFTEEDFGTALYMTALTKCFPGRLPGKSTDRAPTARELNLCAGWLEKQIQIVRPKAIILFGKMAIDRYLGPGPMTERIGESFEKDDRIFIPLPHSSGASTWLNYSENRIRLEAAIDVVRQTRISLTR